MLSICFFWCPKRYRRIHKEMNNYCHKSLPYFFKTPTERVRQLANGVEQMCPTIHRHVAHTCLEKLFMGAKGASVPLSRGMGGIMCLFLEELNRSLSCLLQPLKLIKVLCMSCIH